MKKVIIDCDNTMGFAGRPMDDALAIMYVIGSAQDMELLGICCNFGNGTAAESFECNEAMLRELGVQVPLFKGFEIGEAAKSESADFIVEMANKYPGELVYLGIGSLGNLYAAYLKDNTVFEKIAQIVLMGGITEPLIIHGRLPLDELNFKVNAKGSACVLSKGHNITVITGNNCLPVSALPKDEFLEKLCSSDNPAGMYIAHKCGYRFTVKETVYGADSSYCWDAVAAAYINHPEKFIDHPTPCYINEDDIAASGFLHPCDESEANNVINIPEARTRMELQELFYASWLKLDIKTSSANYSCRGLYLDKLTQPCVLIELSKEPCHGLLLLQKLKETGAVEESLDPAGFYRNLKRMESDGLLTSVSCGNGPKGRRIYSITDFGKRALLNWKDSLTRYSEYIASIIDRIE